VQDAEPVRLSVPVAETGEFLSLAERNVEEDYEIINQ